MIMTRIKLEKLERNDFEVLLYALDHYLQYFNFILLGMGTAQQNIHCSILIVLIETVRARVQKRSLPDKGSLKMEVYAAFVLNDALRYRINTDGASDYERAKCTRLLTALGSFLPTHTDPHNYAVESEI